jgi:hypothetical protein
LTEQLINKGGFAMIDVRDNGHIAEAHRDTLIIRNDIGGALSAICAVRQGKGLKAVQSSTTNPSTRENSVTLLVTITSSRALAWVTVRRSQ